MRPDQVLPVRPAVLPGEALSGYAVRLADANGLHPRALIPKGYADATATAVMVARIAAAAGMTSEHVRAMTLAPMPPSVRGRGKRQRHGWRLHQDVEWVCPVCSHQRGYRALLWRLAIMPLCTRCQVLLVQAHDIPRTHAAPAALLDLTAQLAGLVAATTARRKSAVAKLSAYRRTCAAIALTLDHDWPPRPTELPAPDQQAARTWGLHPCPDPATVATILLAATPMLGNPRVRERFTHQVRGRLERATPEVTSVLLLRRPSPRQRQPVLSGFGDQDAIRLGRFMNTLHNLVTATGLQARHVPGFLLLPGDDPVPPGEAWRDRWLAAVGLHMLICRAHGETGAASTAFHDLGTSDTGTNLFLDGIRLHRGIQREDEELLRAGLDYLLDQDLVDYRRRRQALRPIRRLPSLPIGDDRLPDIGEIPGPRLSLGWMWVHLTRSPMWASPLPSIYTSTVMAFDAALDPEARLLLDHAAHNLLEGPDLGSALPAADATHPASSPRKTG